ncbi:conserved membrane hypothetical protein [Tenacibaculum litopenaei]|uniref:hypothetical protein n=1 Tax=Tenacibaculum litopenaei TaxID=396016 RepID=UPI00389484F6
MTKTETKPPLYFWVIAIVSLFWNAMGVNAYIQQVYKTATFTSMYTAEQLKLIEATPTWAMAAFAIAVFAGFLGCVSLVLRKRFAQQLFLLSMVGIVVQMYYNLFVSNSLEIFGPVAAIMPLTVVAIGLLLYYFSKTSIQKSWLR